MGVRLMIWLFALGLLSLSTGLGPAHARKLTEEVINIYLRAAFATSDRLVKFASPPIISIFCANDEACGPTAMRLESVFAEATRVERTDNENSGAEIEILLYPNLEARRKSTNRYTTKPGEEFAQQIHESCAVIQSRRGDEVVKVIVVALQDAGVRENMACILTEVQRGSGLAMQGRYPDYVKPYTEIDESKFTTILEGFALLMLVHYWDATKAGQDKLSVQESLTRDFDYKK